jgi:hypothetical protein
MARLTSTRLALGMAWLARARLPLDLACLSLGVALLRLRVALLAVARVSLGVAWLGAGAWLGREASGLGMGRLTARWRDGCYLHRRWLGCGLGRFVVSSSAVGRLFRVQDVWGGEPAGAFLLRHGYAACLAVAVDYLARAAGAGTRLRHHLTP